MGTPSPSLPWPGGAWQGGAQWAGKAGREGGRSGGAVTSIAFKLTLQPLKCCEKFSSK